MTHASVSGVAHFAAPDDAAALALIRDLLSYLPSNNTEDPPRRVPGDDPWREDERLDGLVPGDPNKPYDVKEVVRAVVDDGVFLEVHEHYARNLIVGFGRIDGGSVGVVANQPMVLAGTLDIDASLKGARFVRFCDAFNVPLVTSRTSPASSREPTRSTAASSSTGPSSCSPSPRPPFPR